MKTFIRFGITLPFIPTFLFTNCRKQIEVSLSQETQLAFTTTAVGSFTGYTLTATFKMLNYQKIF